MVKCEENVVHRNAPFVVMSGLAITGKRDRFFKRGLSPLKC